MQRDCAWYVAINLGQNLGAPASILKTGKALGKLANVMDTFDDFFFLPTRSYVHTHSIFR